MDRSLNTRLVDMTADDLISLMADHLNLGLKTEPAKPTFEHSDRYVRGISGIARLFGVSKTTIGVYRRQGWIEPAISQMGQTILCDAQLAVELFGKRRNYKQ